MVLSGTDIMRPAPLEWLFKSYDDTGIDKGSQHTKHILAELIQAGGTTKHYEILELINSIWKGRKTLNIRNSQSL